MGHIGQGDRSYTYEINENKRNLRKLVTVKEQQALGAVLIIDTQWHKKVRKSEFRRGSINIIVHKWTGIEKEWVQRIDKTNTSQRSGEGFEWVRRRWRKITSSFVLHPSVGAL